MEKKIFIVGGGFWYASWIEDGIIVKDIKDADIVLFTGGEDVNPALYGAKVHATTYFTVRRDTEEIEAFNKMNENQLALGICRGLQLLNVLNGGLLVQDVENHAIGYTHPIQNNDYTYEITSLHHQMVYPWSIENRDYFNILYWSQRRSRYYEGDKIEKTNYFSLEGEPEVVLYKKPNLPMCLGIQGHPEMMHEKEPVVIMFNEMLNKFMNGELKVEKYQEKKYSSLDLIQDDFIMNINNIGLRMDQEI